MDERRKTMRRWRRALGIARVLFEQEGYHCAYLDEIEEALVHARIRPEQTGFWLRLKVRRQPLTRAAVERYGVEFITTPARRREVARRYPCPTAIDAGAGVFGAQAGLVFVDDDDGRAVAYAPPALVLRTAVQERTAAVRILRDGLTMIDAIASDRCGDPVATVRLIQEVAVETLRRSRLAGLDGSRHATAH